ncbi:MAG: response regulator transcription factor [Armatimonadetes bacterium]|nr:response regulator transcription factor [Armatimonadota bacterium]
MGISIDLVEDEPEVADIAAKYLRNDGYSVKAFYRGDTALEEIRRNPPDLAVLDMTLPGVDGLDILKEIRKSLFFPVILLTSRKDEVDRILGLEMGADDYMTKPFSPRELVARVRSLFRRIEYDKAEPVGAKKVEDQIQTRYLTLDLSKRKLFFRNDSIELTPTEISLLELMMKHPGTIFLREKLIEHVWGQDCGGSTRTIDVHMGNLRQKIKKISGANGFIRGVRSVGYAFEA